MVYDATHIEAKFKEHLQLVDETVVMNPHRYKKTGSSNTAPEPSKAPKA
jgi:hypothetical protein